MSIYGCEIKLNVCVINALIPSNIQEENQYSIISPANRTNAELISALFITLPFSRASDLRLSVGVSVFSSEESAILIIQFYKIHYFPGSRLYAII
jgi:CRISPR/Cas system CMR subunit Cmr6 (Cas7 group RAMP superfamily)